MRGPGVLLAAALAVAVAEESVNVFSTAADATQVALALCSWRSHYEALRLESARRLRFFLVVDPDLDADRACVAASAVLSRAKPYGSNSTTDDWIRCKVARGPCPRSSPDGRRDPKLPK